jgi:DNA-directed RNA polymerase specialized sigma24 family protein
MVMAFPETRLTLIQRIASTGDDADWRQFLGDYWGPVCRFAAQRGSLGLADAEDVASLTFEALIANQLLPRWVINRSAKLRTLLCTVTRNVMSNRARVGQLPAMYFFSAGPVIELLAV